MLKTDWYTWFAWYPVRSYITDKVLWLCYVNRQDWIFPFAEVTDYKEIV